MSPMPGMIIPPLNTPSAERKSIVVAVPQTTTIAARGPSSARAPITAAHRSLPSCAGLRYELRTPHWNSCGTSQYGAGASGHTSSTRIVAVRTRVAATFEMTIRDGVGNFTNCAASAGTSSSSA
jgi:hypothetical protein